MNEYEKFCHWLIGCFDTNESEVFTAKQMQIIKNKLAKITNEEVVEHKVINKATTSLQNSMPFDIINPNTLCIR